jgi:hypothetical protein
MHHLLSERGAKLKAENVAPGPPRGRDDVCAPRRRISTRGNQRRFLCGIPLGADAGQRPAPLRSSGLGASRSTFQPPFPKHAHQAWVPHNAEVGQRPALL